MNELKAAVDAAGIAFTAVDADARVQAAKGAIAAPSIAAWASTQDVVNHVAEREAAAISAATTAAVDQITNGAGAAYDSLLAIQQELQADDTVIAGLLTAMDKRLRFDSAQALSAPEQLTACTNLGIGDPTFDYAAAYVATRDA